MLIGRTNRRTFIAALGGAAAWPIVAWAQQPAKPPTIGFFGPVKASTDSLQVAIFVERLRELGWIEGRNVAMEYRWAEGRMDRYADIAAELVRQKVDVIVTYSTPTVIAIKRATPVDPNRLCFGHRPSGQRPCREPRASWWQRYGFVEPVGRFCWQATRDLARGRSDSASVGDLVQCWCAQRRAGNGGGSGGGASAWFGSRHNGYPAPRRYHACL